MNDVITNLLDWVSEKPEDALFYLFSVFSFFSFVCFVWAIVSPRRASSIAITTVQGWLHKRIFGEAYAPLSRVVTILAALSLVIMFLVAALQVKEGVS